MENEKESSALMAEKNPKSEKQLFIDKLNTLLSEYGYPINPNFPTDAPEDDRVLWRIRDYGISQMLKQARENSEKMGDMDDFEKGLKKDY